MPAVPAVPARLIPRGPVLLVERRSASRILILRGNTLATVVTVRADRPCMATCRMATYGRGMMFHGSRRQQHWPALCASAWFAACPFATAFASDLSPAATAAVPQLVLSSPWQPPVVMVESASVNSEVPSTIEWPAQGPSSSWQPPVEINSEPELGEPELEVTPAPVPPDESPPPPTVYVEPPMQDSPQIAEADDSTKLTRDDVADSVKPEHQEYLDALDDDLAQSFAADAAPPLPVLHAPLPPMEFVVDTDVDAPVPEQAAAPVVTPYSPTTAAITRQLLPSIQHAYGLARHGAIFAARAEFIQVLRRIAQAKDAAANTDIHSKALAAALRAIDEADDFAPQGTEVEGELSVPLIASAHRTPVLAQCPTPPRPIEAIALYHEYARHQFARSVAGEQAGSAALYGLGKMHNRLASGRDSDVRHERQALVLFLASLDVAPGNHLAANEIGVLMARSGRAWEASIMFRHAINVSPSATTYHNLAVVDRQLGYHDQASANEYYARQLAERDRAAGTASQTSGVRWVAPQEMGRTAQPLPMEATQNWANQPPRTMPPRRVTGQVDTAAKWPQKLIPGVFRR